MFRPLFTAITSVTALTDRFVYPDLQPEQQRRRRFLFPLVLVGTTTSIIATAIGLNVQGLASVETLSSLISIVVCIGYLYALRYLKTIQFLLNALAIYYGLLVIYGLLVGAAVGTSYLWLYTYPLIAYFLLGQRGGFRMVALSWIASTLIILFNLGYHFYSFELGLQFVMSYTVICILAHVMESSRIYYYQRLQAEVDALAEAKQQVKTLHTLLPICASCKKIRDDSGYWHQVESYMRHHAGLEFTHSICPDCRTTLYPMLPPDEST